MFAWLRARRWRRSVEDALSSAHFEEERQRLGVELTARATAAVGARRSADPVVDPAAARIAAAVEQQMDRHLLQATLGLRYLAVMEDRLRFADYEDAPRLRAETSWLKRYLAVRLRSKWIRAARLASPDGELPSADVLYAAIAARILDEADAAALAA